MNSNENSLPQEPNRGTLLELESTSVEIGQIEQKYNNDPEMEDYASAAFEILGL